jgi:hypothetical protein
MATKNRHGKRILNCKPSREQEKDYRFEHAAQAGVLAAPAAIPASKDLRASWWKIGDQGETGSCVGWASAEGLCRWHFVQAGRLGKNEMLSPRYVWMAAKETDDYTQSATTFIEVERTSLKAALEIARKYGVVKDSTLPFDGPTLYRGEARTFYTLAGQLRIANYFNLGTDLHNWRVWLATKGPILTRLGVDATWDGADAANPNLDIYKPDTVRGGHAVALVGYTKDRFIVRNSWGTSTWGDKGFGYASNAYAHAAFTEAYGVTL